MNVIFLLSKWNPSLYWQSWWNSGTEIVEQWNNDGGKEEQLWWNSGKEMVERWNSGTDIVEVWNSYVGTVEQIWWNSGTVEQ